MKKFLASILFAVSTVVSAMPIGYIGDLGEAGKAGLLLHNTPCENAKAMEKIKEDYRKDFFHGEYTKPDGTTIVACWVISGNTIFISDEEGDLGKLPANLVKPLTKL